MQIKSSKKLFHVQLELPKEMSKIVKVKAVDRPTAERVALKRNPSALRTTHAWSE